MHQGLPDTLGELTKALTMMLEEGGILTAELDARIMVQQRCGVTWADIIAKPFETIPQEQCKQLLADLRERLGGKPLSRMYGVREFWGLEFEVTQDVLDPRPDSETVIDVAIQRFKKGEALEILDLGTGSGCLLVALLDEFKNARGVGVDLSLSALDVAQRNAERHDVIERSHWIRSDWFDSIEAGRKFDLIVANPPYIRESVIPELDIEVRNFDPILALDGGVDGLQAYNKIFSSLISYLKSDGLALFEIGYDQAEDVMRLSRESRFHVVNVHPDLAGQPRVVEISCGDK